ncbi:MAG: hypothetical protein KA759_04755 [Zoogloea sp.]|nr:hypothetical protein [Zoogloea sp.]
MDARKRRADDVGYQVLIATMGMAFSRHELLMEEPGSDYLYSRIECDFNGQEDGILDVIRMIYIDTPTHEDDDLLTHGLVVLAYIVAAQRAIDDNNMTASWMYVTEANYWLGVASARRDANPDPKTVRSELARSAAQRRHDETQKLKEEALAIWRKDVDPSLSNEQAAEFLRRHIPLTTRTLSRYVSEAKKKRSH